MTDSNKTFVCVGNLIIACLRFLYTLDFIRKEYDFTHPRVPGIMVV
jgi:hypothetical protein